MATNKNGATRTRRPARTPTRDAARRTRAKRRRATSTDSPSALAIPTGPERERRQTPVGGGLLTPAAAAARFGLDAQRGAAWLVEEARRCSLDHVRHGDAILFLAETLDENLAWLWFLSDLFTAADRQRLRTAEVERHIDRLCQGIRSATNRVAMAMSQRAASGYYGHFVRPCDVGQAVALGCDIDSAGVWPIEVRATSVDQPLILSIWSDMPEAKRRRCVRQLMAHRKAVLRAST